MRVTLEGFKAMGGMADLSEEQRIFVRKSVIALVVCLLVPFLVVCWAFDFDATQEPLRTIAWLVALVGFPGWVVIVGWRAVVKFRN